jgi:ankyrin repeat protein
MDNRNHTALWGSACNGHTEIVKILLGSGADANLKPRYGYDWFKFISGSTALACAESNGHSDTVQLLKNAGVKK